MGEIEPLSILIQLFECKADLNFPLNSNYFHMLYNLH